jgi:hypothetical protein
VFARHPSRRLAAYCDGQLPVPEAHAIEAHIAACERCRRQCDEIRFAASLLRQLTVASAPPSVWHAIDGRLRTPATPRRFAHGWQLAAAACVALVVAVGLHWQLRSAGAVWQVAVQEPGQSETVRKAAGEWVETTAASRAQIVVGTIGTVDVEPNARVRLGAVTGSQYRLALERGTISAAISAPPRMFIVDTPASPVIDLGCAYTVTVGLDGVTELRMTSGWAALEWKGSETLVPAGAISRTRKGRPPGIPYFEDAPPTFQQAIDSFGENGVTNEWLTHVLAVARVRDTLTLWHLLSQTGGDQRARVYDRMHALVPPPPGVERDRVLQLDADALRKWREELAWHW